MKQTTLKTDASGPESSRRRKKRSGSEQRQSLPQSSRSTQGQLTAKKIRTAWTRLGKTIQEFCRQPSRKCALCLVSEDRIAFRNSGDPNHCELRLNGNIIIRDLNGAQDFTEIILIKRHGLAYENAGRRMSATMFSLKLLSEQSSGHIPQTSNPAKIGCTLSCTTPALPVDPPKHKVPRIFTPDEVLSILADAAMRPVHQVLEEKNISRATYEQWKEKLTGLQIDQVRYLLNLESENARLAAVIRTLQMDKRMLQEVLSQRTGLSGKGKRLPRAMASRMNDALELDLLALPAAGL